MWDSAAKPVVMNLLGQKLWMWPNPRGVDITQAISIALSQIKKVIVNVDVWVIDR
jgi:hypothetical protein